jgi:hypothetical protein
MLTLKQAFLRSLSGALDAGVKETLKKIEEKTPTDTKTLLKGYKTQKLDYKTAEISNDTQYAGWIEYGVGGNNYNYHK